MEKTYLSKFLTSLYTAVKHKQKTPLSYKITMYARKKKKKLLASYTYKINPELHDIIVLKGNK